MNKIFLYPKETAHSKIELELEGYFIYGCILTDKEHILEITPFSLNKKSLKNVKTIEDFDNLIIETSSKNNFFGKPILGGYFLISGIYTYKQNNFKDYMKVKIESKYIPVGDFQLDEENHKSLLENFIPAMYTVYKAEIANGF